jgi:MSHA pilin protein MshA
MRNIKRQSGFTLIELIIVIVILGVLSAFALPRFADLGVNARVSTINGVAGTMKSAAAIAHSQWIVDGNTSSTSVTLDGAAIDMSFGYPTMAGVLVASQISGTDFDTSTTPGSVFINGAPTEADCSVSYNEATSLTSPAVVNSVVITGC